MTVKPRKGKALLWTNVKEEDLEQLDVRTSHEAAPVVKGRKYAANSWIRLYDFQQSSRWGCIGGFALLWVIYYLSFSWTALAILIFYMNWTTSYSWNNIAKLMAVCYSGSLPYKKNRKLMPMRISREHIIYSRCLTARTDRHSDSLITELCWSVDSAGFDYCWRYYFCHIIIVCKFWKVVCIKFSAVRWYSKVPSKPKFVVAFGRSISIELARSWVFSRV